MSSKLIKQPGHLIDLPNDEVIISLKIWKSGKRQLEAPLVHPTELIKLLHGTIVDVMFVALTPDNMQPPKEESRIIQ
jgi:hypothetical protein